MTCEKLKIMQTELKKLIKNKNTTNKEYEAFYDKYGIPYKNKVEAEIKNSCGDNSALGGVNTIKILPECVKNAEELCMAIHNVPREVVDGNPNLIPWYFRDCYEKYGPYANFNEQSNLSSVNSDCTVNTVLNDLELNNNKEMAIVVAMILAEQEIKCNPNESSDYFYNFGTTENISSINRCLNTALSEQRNYLDGCRFSNRRQENISQIVNNCITNTTIGNPVNPTPIKPPDYIQPDISPIFTNPAPSYINPQNTTPQNINPQNINPQNTTPSNINTTTFKPTENSITIIIVVAIFLVAILVGYFLF
jgi:hypothetical protein